LEKIREAGYLITAAAALVALAGIGIFRPLLPDLLREHWTTVVIFLALSASVALICHLRYTDSSDPHPYILTAIFSLVLAAMYIQPQRVASDGIFYFAPLRSLVVDGDLDFENEYRNLGAREAFFHRTPTGKLPNHHSLGPALVWTPAYLLVHAVAWLGFLRPTGIGYPYFTAVATTTAIGGFFGVLWLYWLVRAYFDPSVAFAATVLIWLGSFHLWYMVIEPSMAHALAMATVGGYLLLCQRGPEGWRAFALIGVAAGLVLLVRWQNVVFLPAGVVLVLLRGGRRPLWWEMGIGVGTAAVIFIPQILYWKVLFGRFFLVPQGENFMQWSNPQFEAVLFSSRHGLFSWSPLLLAGAIGFAGFFRKSPALAASLFAGFLAALYVNASVYDWWAGASFGSRRFDGALPAFGLGLAVAVEWMLPWVRRHALVVVCALLAPFCVWALMLMAVVAGGGVPPDGAVSFRQVGADALEIVYRYTGYPFSWPGSFAEKFRSGLPLAAYDLAGAHHPSNNVEIRMGDNDALYLGPGWSLPRRGRGWSVRIGASSGAFLYVALREPAPYRMTLEGNSHGEFEVFFNKHSLGQLEFGDKDRITIEILPEWIHSGVNEIGFFSADRKPYSIYRLFLVRPGNF
jgi:hypothetical protein